MIERATFFDLPSVVPTIKPNFDWSVAAIFDLA
jgi:hypothetical protein